MKRGNRPLVQKDWPASLQRHERRFGGMSKFDMRSQGQSGVRRVCRKFFPNSVDFPRSRQSLQSPSKKVSGRDFPGEILGTGSKISVISQGILRGCLHDMVSAPQSLAPGGTAMVWTGSKTKGTGDEVDTAQGPLSGNYHSGKTTMRAFPKRKGLRDQLGTGPVTARQVHIFQLRHQRRIKSHLVQGVDL